METLENLIQRYPRLSVCRGEIERAFETLKDCFEAGNKLLIAGNGGSCADAEHIAGELMKGFLLKRVCKAEFAEKLIACDPVRGRELKEKLQEGLPTIVLSGHPALSTAYVNDVEDGAKYVYAQQVHVFGKAGDVFWGISTSGNAENVLHAAVTARAKGMKVITLTGESGGKLKSLADVCIKVPETETYRVQELHLPVYHCLCLMLETHFFAERNNHEDRI